MPNYNRETGIPYGVIAVQSLDQDWIWDEINNLESPELNKAYQEAAREAAGYLLAKGEIDITDFPEGCEEGDEEDALAQMSDSEVSDLVDQVNPDFCQTFYDGLDESEFRKEGEIDGIPVSVSSLGGAQLLWVLGGPHIGWCKRTSPCMPEAGDCDNPCEEGERDAVQCYMPPPDWLRKVDD